MVWGKTCQLIKLKSLYLSEQQKLNNVKQLNIINLLKVRHIVSSFLGYLLLFSGIYPVFGHIFLDSPAGACTKKVT